MHSINFVFHAWLNVFKIYIIFHPIISIWGSYSKEITPGQVEHSLISIMTLSVTVKILDKTYVHHVAATRQIITHPSYVI